MLKENTKLKVIIIDDEMLIRKLVRMKLDVDGLDLEIVGEYSNGLQAMEGVRETMPDIVISDICMPEEDGLSFGEKCMQSFPGTKIIILTGFDDFEYVRRSIKAGVFDYLMKPVQAEELNAAVARAAQVIRRANEEEKIKQELMEEINSNIPALRNIYISHVLQDGVIDKNFEKKLKQYNVSINPSIDSVMQIGMLTIREVLDRSSVGINIKNEVAHFFQNEVYVTVLSDAWGRVVVINNDQNVPLEECFEIILQIVERKWGYHLEWGISERYRMEESSETEETASVWNHISTAYKQAIDNLSASHKKKDRSVHVESGESIKEDVEKQQMTMRVALEKATTADPKKGRLMQEIIGFMRSNLDMTDMSLTFLSDKYDVSVSNLNRMFKRFTGKTYVEVLSLMKLNAMLELMKNSELKDKEIGELIGITDPHYLSIWFKKTTGLSVTEYRAQL